MPTLRLKQLQYESESWKRLLAFMMDENVHLKNRLSTVLKDQFDRNLLDNIEDFQNRFIREDETISLLRKRIADLDQLLVREKFEDGKVIKQAGEKLKKVRNEIRIAEGQFTELKLSFNSYLEENT